MASDQSTSGTYLEAALERGRPSEPCECAVCDCDLHTYPDDVSCIWCRNDDHGERQRCPACFRPLEETDGEPVSGYGKTYCRSCSAALFDNVSEQNSREVDTATERSGGVDGS